jgi:hypothetical protein
MPDELKDGDPQTASCEIPSRFPPQPRRHPAVGDASGVSLAAPAPSLLADRRTAAIEKLIVEGLGNPSPLVANLQAQGGDLLELAHAYKAVLTQEVGPKNKQDLEQLTPYLQTYVALCRQAERMLRLSHEIGQGQTNKARCRRSANGTCE